MHDYDDEEREIARLQLMNSEGLSAWALADCMIAIADRENGPKDANEFMQRYDTIIRRGLEQHKGSYDVEYLNLLRARMDAALIDQCRWRARLFGVKGSNLN
ncbi:MAG: hypothetical protein F4X63_08210 [Nitrospira sp. SB0662_bin_26]|nr:hypothetical protein [Nitrospira sp. SB0662_bin_26]